MDIDGTLTDGKIYIGATGELMKAFDAKDGYAIHNILPQHGIIPVIITGRISEIVEQRAKELEIAYLCQGVSDKAACLRKVVADLDIPLDHVACIGDDLNDLSMMNLCGVKGCPADAVPEIREVCNYVCKAPGGRGAVREFIEWIVHQHKD